MGTEIHSEVHFIRNITKEKVVGVVDESKYLTSFTKLTHREIRNVATLYFVWSHKIHTFGEDGGGAHRGP